MQSLKLIVAGLMILCASNMQAQVSINMNLGVAPPWGPQVEANVRYYYLPDIDAYYDLNTSMFVYCHHGNWLHRRQLPGRFRTYDLYHGRKVVIHDYRGNTPYSYSNYRTKRGRYDDNHHFERSGRGDRSGNKANYRNLHEDHERRNDASRGKGNAKFVHDNGQGNDHGNRKGREN